MTSTALLVTLAALGVIILSSEGDCACCNPRLAKGCDANGRQISLYWEACGDCSKGTPNCGYRKCNIFGCACGGGCRTGSCSNPGCSRGKRSVAEVATSVHRVLRSIDTNRDGRINIEEAKNTTFIDDDIVNIEGEFELMDVNQDGFLTPDEIDYDA